MRPRLCKPRKLPGSKRLNARRNGRRLRALPQGSRWRVSPLSDLGPTMSNSALKGKRFFGASARRVAPIAGALARRRQAPFLRLDALPASRKPTGLPLIGSTIERSERVASGRQRRTKSYHNRGPRHLLEGVAQALDARIDLVGRAEIENQQFGSRIGARPAPLAPAMSSARSDPGY